VIQAREWMRHWTRRGKPIRWVVRDASGVLHGWAERSELDTYILEIAGETEVLDLKEKDEQ
jgi:hypothetical protein